MALSDKSIKSAKPTEKKYKLQDRDGMYLLVQPTGTRSFKYDYRLHGKKGTYTIGTYPEVSLSEARIAVLDARRLVSEGTDPVKEKQEQKRKQSAQGKKFSDYCKVWIDKQNYRPTTLKDLVQRLEKNIYPFLDQKKVDQFSTGDLLDIMQPMIERGARETAKRMARVIKSVYNELIILSIVENNPAASLVELIPKPDNRKKSNFGHQTEPDQFKLVLKAIYKPAPRRNKAVDLALKLTPLLFLRPKNIRYLKWEYIDFNKRLMTIPPDEMKAGKELKVPLSDQAFAILRDAYATRLDETYVFVSSHGKGQPISENTVTAAIRKMTNPETGKPFGTGFMTSHGFRHTASTFLNEMDYNPDAIELQLAHINQDRIRATYNKAQLLEERTKMMQDWADYLSELVTS